MRKRKMKDSTKGITLVALVVTIAILLILAGITIASFTGDKGLLNETKEMKNSVEGLQNQTINDTQSIMNELASSIGGALDPAPDNPDNPDTPTNPEKPVETPIENIKSDWDIINKIAKEIAKDNTITNESEEATVIVEGKKYTIKPGNLFEVEYDGEVRRVRVLGFKHDELVDTEIYGNGITASKASISFEFYDFMTGNTAMSMNKSDTNTGGWAATKMRKDLNGYTTNSETQSGSIGGLGTKLSNQGYIKQVKKQYIQTYNDASTNNHYAHDYLWLLASSEVFNSGYREGAFGYTITTEGSQYKYYQGVTAEWNLGSTGRRKYNASAAFDRWWLRSAYQSKYSVGFSIICAAGNGDALSASGEACVSTGFCI